MYYWIFLLRSYYSCLLFLLDLISLLPALLFPTDWWRWRFLSRFQFLNTFPCHIWYEQIQSHLINEVLIASYLWWLSTRFSMGFFSNCVEINPDCLDQSSQMSRSTTMIRMSIKTNTLLILIEKYFSTLMTSPKVHCVI